jgi:hypothetical protein
MAIASTQNMVLAISTYAKGLSRRDMLLKTPRMAVGSLSHSVNYRFSMWNLEPSPPVWGRGQGEGGRANARVFSISYKAGRALRSLIAPYSERPSPPDPLSLAERGEVHTC